MKGQYAALVRHFFGRFFDNEFVAANADTYATVVKILALLATPGLCLPFLRYTTYLHLDHYPPEARLPFLWYDRCFFISFAMLVMGGVTVLEWDALFPDRRDYASLIPLPIRARTMFLAKIGALVLFLVGFTAIVNFPSAVMFPVFSFRGRGISSWPLFFWTMIAQSISVLCASAFVFLSMVAIEGVLLNVLSVKWFRKVSVYVQCATVFALLSLFFVFQNMASKIATARDAVFEFPPAWFLGLNETLLGTTDPAFHHLARVALTALGSATLISAIAYAVAYRRHVKRTLESIEGEGSRSRVDEWITALADRLVPNRVERATVAFVGKTIARSPKHRVFLAAYIGVGCAFILQALLESGLRQAWLSVPLVLSFFTLSGLRYIFTLPSELPANWIFRVTEFDTRRHALDGARRAMLWFAVVPLFAPLAPFFFLLWTPSVAIAHLIFSVTISMLLIEALLLDFWKIPFTCTYPPGKANVTILWIVYWVAFTTYAYSMASLEAWMVLRPFRLVVFYFVVAAVWSGFVWYRRRWERVGYSLVFDDAPDPIVRTLGISEIAWQK